MKLSCSVYVGNRLLPTALTSTKRSFLKSTLALCKSPKSSKYCIILFSSVSKHGTSYDVKNISKVLTRFINEGKSTIQFTNPQHDLYIQADSILLKSFLHLLKKSLENKITDKELKYSNMSVTPSKAPPTKLIIKQRSDYPPHGLPRTLEILHINSIKRCSLDRGVLQLAKLKVLNLRDNLIEHLPIEISNLPNLAELDVSSNELGKSTLKQWSWLGGNLQKSLKLLNLSQNKLSSLPDFLIKLDALVSLNLDKNNLKLLPSGIGTMRHLKIFTCSHNKLSSLPGSFRKLQLENLDLSNNNFDSTYQCNQAAMFPKPLAVWTLKDYTARRVLNLRLPYTPATLPRTVINYLDGAKYCVCGKACFDIYIKREYMLSLMLVSQSVNMSEYNSNYVLSECIFCSLKCFSSMHRNRRPFII